MTGGPPPSIMNKMPSGQGCRVETRPSAGDSGLAVVRRGVGDDRPHVETSTTTMTTTTDGSSSRAASQVRCGSRALHTVAQCVGSILESSSSPRSLPHGGPAGKSSWSNEVLAERHLGLFPDGDRAEERSNKFIDESHRHIDWNQSEAESRGPHLLSRNSAFSEQK